ncbi:AsnC family protein [Phytohabitans rumicis]|uniref:Uncharacterized protein n=1 Tax=Phytohabitans rumicis TaxID=1076125 RepID=A0A6V8L9X8_9ACTN|nr:AsnC family protein [Phytohabitans rumicis]GFJ93144.1 hypothetical protein Prum_067860 [Phytohabitans rumicis]
MGARPHRRRADTAHRSPKGGSAIGQPPAQGRAPQTAASARIQPLTEELQNARNAGADAPFAVDTDLEQALVAVEVDLDDRARQAAARLADGQLRDELAAAGFTGPKQELFELEAAEYGIGVFMKWLRTGEVYKHAAAKRRVVEPPRRELTVDERRGLTNLIIGYGLAYFRKQALVGGRWRPDGGASLKTFFVGACLLQFKAAFEYWRGDTTGAESAADAVEEVATFCGQTHGDAADQALLHQRTWGVVEKIRDETTKKILVCVAAGMPYKDIAEAVGGGLTAEAVGARIQRIRAQHQPDPTGRRP